MVQICVFLPTVGRGRAQICTLIHANLESQIPSLVVTSAAVIALLERKERGMNGWGRRGGAERHGHAYGDATVISEQPLNF